MSGYSTNFPNDASCWQGLPASRMQNAHRNDLLVAWIPQSYRNVGIIYVFLCFITMILKDFPIENCCRLAGMLARYLDWWT